MELAKRRKMHIGPKMYVFDLHAEYNTKDMAETAARNLRMRGKMQARVTHHKGGYAVYKRRVR